MAVANFSKFALHHSTFTMGIQIDKKSDKKASKAPKVDKKGDKKATKSVAAKPVPAKKIPTKAVAVGTLWTC